MAFTKITRTTEDINTGFGRVNTLIDDLKAVTNAKGASQIGLEDSAGNVTATNVEDAIAEIYTDTASVIILNNTFDENSSTTTGLTWGYQGGTFRLDNVVTTKTAGTVAGLTDDDVNYIEIDPSDGVVKSNITGFTSGSIPIREVTTSSGSQTVSTDKRAWFSQVAAATTSTSGIVELSTDAEAVTGTSDAVVVTPDNLTARMKAPGEIGGTTAAAGNFTNVALTSINTDISSTEVGYLNGVTSAIQTQFGNEAKATLTTAGDVLYASGVNTLARLAKGTAGQAVVMNSGATAPEWADVAPSGHIQGLVLSNAASPDEDITISAGRATDSTNTQMLVLSSAQTKEIDSNWATGTGAGGLATTLTAAASTWYAVHLVLIDSVVEVGFDTSATAATLIAEDSATAYRRIGWILTDGDTDILTFTDVEIAGGAVDREWKAQITDLLNSTTGGSRQLLTVSAPANSIVNLSGFVSSGSNNEAWFKSTSFTDIDPDSMGEPDIRTSANDSSGTTNRNVFVDGSNQIAWRQTAIGSFAFSLHTNGYTDRRV